MLPATIGFILLAAILFSLSRVSARNAARLRSEVKMKEFQVQLAHPSREASNDPNAIQNAMKLAAGGAETAGEVESQLSSKEASSSKKAASAGVSFGRA